jgi:hypothetical protein
MKLCQQELLLDRPGLVGMNAVVVAAPAKSKLTTEGHELLATTICGTGLSMAEFIQGFLEVPKSTRFSSGNIRGWRKG